MSYILKNICAQFSEADFTKRVKDAVIQITQCVYANAKNDDQLREASREVEDKESCVLCQSSLIELWKIFKRINVLSTLIQDCPETQAILAKYQRKK